MRSNPTGAGACQLDIFYCLPSSCKQRGANHVALEVCTWDTRSHRARLTVREVILCTRDHLMSYVLQMHTMLANPLTDSTYAVVHGNLYTKVHGVRNGAKTKNEC